MGKAKEKWRKKAWMVNPNKARIILAATASQRRSIEEQQQAQLRHRMIPSFLPCFWCLQVHVWTSLCYHGIVPEFGRKGIFAFVLQYVDTICTKHGSAWASRRYFHKLLYSSTGQVTSIAV
jgi:hypothetical protein